MGHPMRLELTRVGLLVELANHNTTRSALNNSHNDYSNNTSKENDCNFKIKANSPMKALCNFENVIYQGVIFPKENIKKEINKSLYRNFIDKMEIKV